MKAQAASGNGDISLSKIFSWVKIKPALWLVKGLITFTLRHELRRERCPRITVYEAYLSL